MTWYSSKDVGFVFIGDQNITTLLNSARMKTEAVLTDTTGLGNTWREMTDTGLRRGELEFSGFYDGLAVSMNTVSGTDRVVSVLLEGNTVSKRFQGYRAAIVSGAEIGISPESVHTSTPTTTVRGAVDFGYVAAPRATRTTAGNTQSTYADMGAAADNGRAYLHILSLTLGGYTNLVVTVQHSDDHDTWADHTAFTAATATGAETIALTGTVNRYLAIKWEWTGAGTGNTFSAFVGVAPV